MPLKYNVFLNNKYGVFVMIFIKSKYPADDFNNLNNAMNSQYNGGVREDTSYIGNIAADNI